MDRYREVLSGYKPQELPDLSGRRFPPGVVHTVVSSLPRPYSQNQSFALYHRISQATIFAATARIIGAYCDSTDVLLGLALDDPQSIKPLRISWDEHQTWQDVIFNIASIVADPSWPFVPLPLLNQVLEVDPGHPTCLAVVCFAQRLSNAGTGFPPTMFVGSLNSSLSLTVSDRFMHETSAELFLTQVEGVYECALRDPVSPMSALRGLTDNVKSTYKKFPLKERRGLSTIAISHVPFATDYLSLRADTYPNQTAVRWYPHLTPDLPPTTFHFDTITYHDWEKRANQLGRWLIAQGLQREDRVAVCMERNISFHVAFVAILRAGGCYVPIDPELPQERQIYIAQDSCARFVIVGRHSTSFTYFGHKSLDIDGASERKAIAMEPDFELNLARSDGLSYLLYTSGTTGNPKGCLLTHHGLTEAIWALSDMCGQADIRDPSKGNYLSVASIAFDVHISEILVAVANRLPILVAPRSELFEDLPHYVKEFGVSHLGIVPSLIEATMGTVEESGDTSSLRYVASGGEKMSDAILDKWANHPTVRLANFYGPSEVTIGCAARFMNRVTPRANIGHPFANVSAHVVDENMSIVLRGAPGELVVEGPLVGRGYLNRPDLTQKVFLEFPEKGKGRWAYRTGDLVRMMADSTMEILGRIDHQIKLRGVRIESEGISSIIRRAGKPDIALEVVTILTKHPAILLEQLVAFFSWDIAVPISRRKTNLPLLIVPPPGLMDRIRSACDRELASYMRPSHILPISWIPLNNNGKVDSKALAQWFMDLPMDRLTGLNLEGVSIQEEDDPVAEVPSSEIELDVMDVVRKALNVPANALTASANLFALGLDSMGAIQLSTDLKKVLPQAISPADILTHPTARDIAVRLEDLLARVNVGSPSYVGRFSSNWLEVIRKAFPLIPVVGVMPPFPLQEGVLFRSVESSTMYVQHVLVRCHEGTSMRRLRDAWQAAMTRHDILRTIFYFGRDLVQVVIHPDGCILPWSEEHTDVDEQSFQNNFETGDALSIASDINTSLSSVPAFRLSNYTSTAGVRILVLSIHHALFDGTSLPILFQDVEREYLQGPPIHFPNPSAILDTIYTLDLSQAQRFWTQNFSDFDWQGTRFGVPSTTTVTLTSAPFQLPLSALKAKASDRQVTLQTVLTCAYGCLIATHLYGRNDVAFGIIRNGRLLQIEGIGNAMCPMITVLPCRLRYHDMGDVLLRTQAATSQAVEFEHVALSRIHRWVGSEQGLFETLFSVSFHDDGKSSLWDVIGSQNPQPEYILAVEVVLHPGEDRLVVHAAYTPDDLSSEIVEGIVRDLEKISLQLCTGDMREPLSKGSVIEHPIKQVPIPKETNDIFSPSLPPDEEVVGRVREVVSEFLRLEPSLLLDNTSLISMGLDSIRSVGLSRTLQVQGLHIRSVSIMRHPTLTGIASQLSRKLPEPVPSEEHQPTLSFKNDCQTIRDALDSSELELTSNDHVELFPTTTLQAGMLSQTISSGGRRYIHLFPLRLKPGTDAQRLRGAWETVVQSSSILRTSFHYLADLGVWVQGVHSITDLKWSEDVLAPNGTSHRWFEDLLSSFDWDSDRDCLHRPPLYLHFHRGPDASLLFISLHHALYDGFSIAKLLQVVEAVYDGQQSRAVSNFTDVLPQILWQERHGTQYFLRLLETAEPKPLPRVGIPSDRTYFHSREITIEEDLLERIRARAGVTLQCLGQVAFAQLLALLTRSKDVVFGHVVSGRSIPGAEEVLGPVLSTIPFRVKLNATQSNFELLRSVHKSNIDALPWQHASLRAVQHAKGVESLWDSLFVFQPEQPGSGSSDDPLWTFEPIDDNSEASTQYALNLELHKKPQGFTVQAACSADVMDAEGLSNALLEFERLLRNIINLPEQSSCEDIPVFAPPRVETPPSTPSPSTTPIGVLDENFSVLNNLLSTLSRAAVGHIHPGTSLIALGIDSIAAIQLASKARQLGFSLRAQDVVKSRTVADLYHKCRSHEVVQVVKSDETVEAMITEEEFTQIRSILEGDASSETAESWIESIANASSGIKWLIGAWQKSNGSRFQHAFAYHLPIDLGAEKVREVWSRLVHRHAILRSTIVSSPGSAQPRIVTFRPHNKLVDSTWSERSLSDTESPQREVVENMKNMIANPPSLRRPPTRARFLSSNEGNFLILYMNHFQYDAWSLPLLVDDLAHIIRGEQAESKADLVKWLNAGASNPETAKEQEEYWRSLFPHSFQPIFFPSTLDSYTPDNGLATTNRVVYTKVDAVPHASLLETRARQRDVSLQSVLLAAWTKVQAQITMNNTVTFGLWHAGRSGAMVDGGLEGLAVPCMNVLPFYVSQTSGDNILQVALKIQEGLRKRTPVVEQTDLEKVDEWVGGRGKPLCNVYVNVVKVAPEISMRNDGLLRGVEVPYTIPDIEDLQADVVGRLSVTDLIQDDVMIDIILSPEDTVGMSIEAASSIMDISTSKGIIEEWGEFVKEALQN